MEDWMDYVIQTVRRQNAEGQWEREADRHMAESEFLTEVALAKLQVAPYIFEVQAVLALWTQERKSLGALIQYICDSGILVLECMVDNNLPVQCPNLFT
jgi:hypothetical protein